MKNRSIVLVYLLILVHIAHNDASAQSGRKHMEKGITAYDEGNFEEAEKAFGYAKEKGNATAIYNQANARMQQKKYAEAIEDYKEVLANKSKIPGQLLIDAQFNLGNAYLKNNEFDKAIDSYKQTLKLKPGHPGAAHNLLLARQQKTEQQNQQNKQDEAQGENKKQNDEQKNSDSSDSDTQENQKNKSEQVANDIPVNTEQLLQVIENEENKVRQKMQQIPPKQRKSDKNW